MGRVASAYTHPPQSPNLIFIFADYFFVECIKRDKQQAQHRFFRAPAQLIAPTPDNACISEEAIVCMLLNSVRNKSFIKLRGAYQYRKSHPGTAESPVSFQNKRQNVTLLKCPHFHLLIVLVIALS